MSLREQACASARILARGPPGCACAPYHQQPMALLIASDLHKDIAGRAAAARRLVQARAPRTADDRGAQRRRQDDAAADARGRDLDRPRRAERRQGRAHRPARPAPAARARRWRCATTCSRAAPRSSQIEAELARARGADGRRATPTRRRSRATPRAQARLEARGGYLWRNRATAMAHGLGFRDARPRPPARHLLRRAADARLARPRARHRRRRAAARRAHEPPRHRVAGVARADARRARRGGRAGRPRPLVPGGGRHGGARAARPAARASSPAPGTSGAASRPRARSRWARRSTRSRPRSSAWSASSSASATRRRKARQAQSRVKKLAKIERIERDPTRRRGPGVRASPRRSAPGG